VEFLSIKFRNETLGYFQQTIFLLSTISFILKERIKRICAPIWVREKSIVLLKTI